MGEEETSEEKTKSEKGTHLRHIIRSQRGDTDDANKSWRSIFDLEEKEENTKRKGSADAQTVSQPEQQAGPSQRGAGVEMQQAQGQVVVDRAELEMGDDPPSRYLVDQGVSTGPRVAAGATQCKSPDLDGPADEIVSAV